MASAVSRARHALSERIPHWSPSLLGLGILMAWAALVSAWEGEAFNPYNRGQLALDMGSLLPFVLFTCLPKRIGPLFDSRKTLLASVGIMLAGSVIVVVSRVISPDSPVLWVRIAGTAFAGIGYAVALLYWWKAIAMLSPAEVAFYVASAWVVRQLLVVLLEGFEIVRLTMAMLTLPLISALMLGLANDHLISLGPAVESYRTAPVFPWKPLLLVGLYSFGYGCGTWLLRYEPNTWQTIGIIIPAIIIIISLLFPNSHFNFMIVYRLIIPFSIIGLLALFLVASIGSEIATVLIRASYTLAYIFASVVLCNLSRRYRISATWLFSLFNATLIIMLGVGTVMCRYLPFPLVLGLCLLSVLAISFVIVGESSLSSNWGMAAAHDQENSSWDAEMRIDVISSELSSSCHLTSREREVLDLLARGNTPQAIASMLFIAPGTAKAHIGHIYKKLGIHTHEEFEKLYE